MSTKNIRTAKCPICDRWITLKANGTFRSHGPQAAPCIAVCSTPEDAARLILPPLSSDQLDMMRECYRIGDWRPIEIEFGIKCLHYNLGGTEDDALAELIDDVRHWIAALVRLSQVRAERWVS
ncbi:MAG: hypothetical protein HYZ38_27640 [Mycobacterium sp.]|nr:hypothetical protein [Mycobacterium sp.]